jgi:two-component system, OmpR family, response regulator PhoP
MRILIVEDEVALRKTLTVSFAEAGFSVLEAGDGQEGLFAALECPVDVAVVDLGLPRIPGLDLIRQLRARHNVLPVLVLSARKTWESIVEVLGAGADDYLCKPCRFEELLARVQTLVRRRNAWATSDLACGAITLQITTRTVSVNGRPVELTSFEYRLLEHLMLWAGRVVSGTELLERLYGEEAEPDYNAIGVLIARLRRKLDPDETIAPIETVRGSGYRLALPRAGSL